MLAVVMLSINRFGCERNFNAMARFLAEKIASPAGLRGSPVIGIFCPTRLSRNLLSMMRGLTAVADEGRVPFLPILSLDPVVRFLAVITFNVVFALSIGPLRAAAQGSIDRWRWGGTGQPASYCDLPDGTCCDAAEMCGIGADPSAFGSDAFGSDGFGSDAFGSDALYSAASGSTASDDLFWLDSVRVGYDKGFVIASQRDLELETSNFPYRLQINGWGQLRYTATDVTPPNTRPQSVSTQARSSRLSGARVQSRRLLFCATRWAQQ